MYVEVEYGCPQLFEESAEKNVKNNDSGILRRRFGSIPIKRERERLGCNFTFSSRVWEVIPASHVVIHENRRVLPVSNFVACMDRFFIPPLDYLYAHRLYQYLGISAFFLLLQLTKSKKGK
jgi:hypothetical protein